MFTSRQKNMECQSHALMFCLLTDCKQTLFGGTAHQSSDPPLNVIWMGVPEVSNSLVKNIDHWQYWPNVCIGNTIATCRILIETIKGTYNQSILPFPFLNGW